MHRTVPGIMAILLAAHAYTQPTPAATLQTTTTLVLVPTLVQSQAGDLIHSLHAGDFLLTDNGVRQTVSLDAEDVQQQPLAVVILLQTGASASRHFADYTHIGTMLDAMTGTAPHQAALVTFDSQPEAIWDFTANLDDLQDGFQRPGQGDDKAAIYDAVNYGIDLLRQQPARARRVLILLSQTQDSGSKAKVDDVVRRLGENNITIYTVAFSPEKTWLKDQFTKPRRGNPPYAMPNHEALLYTFDLSTPLGMAFKAMQTNAAAEIATLSGGEYVPFSARRDLEQSLSALANHIPNRYILSFRPASSQPGFHTLHVEITGQPTLKLSARTSYWATPDPAH